MKKITLLFMFLFSLHLMASDLVTGKFMGEEPGWFSSDDCNLMIEATTYENAYGQEEQGYTVVAEGSEGTYEFLLSESDVEYGLESGDIGTYSGGDNWYSSQTIHLAIKLDGGTPMSYEVIRKKTFMARTSSKTLIECDL